MENIYITWHYTTHGIAYQKHILSAFYANLCSINDSKISVDDISQDEMNEIFDKHKQGFYFDKIYYLTSDQDVFDRISSRRFYYRRNMLDDELVISSGTQPIWEDLLQRNWIDLPNTLQLEIEYVKNTYPEKYETWFSQVWRDMQHYPIDSQLYWFCNLSNAATIYGKRLHEIKLKVTDLRNEQNIAAEVAKWITTLSKKHKDANFIINVSLGSSETQVAWQLLGELNMLPVNTRFIKTYDNKADGRKDRFKIVSIIEVNTHIIAQLKSNFKLFENTVVPGRQLANLKMQNFLKQGFAILIFGERGTGKSKLVEENKGNKKPVSVNCASFDDDSKAESELFGYVKWAFTGANNDKTGLFHEANNGILFLDEVHHLSKRVQGKLMKAMQTDDNNNFTIRRLGASTEEKIKCTVILATNKTVNEFREMILPDFYDRISQLIIELPPLRETREDLQADWQAIWKQLRFDEFFSTPVENELFDWLNNQPLYGNYRDLQKIAILYKSFLSFDAQTKKMTNCKSPLHYVKSEFSKYHSIATVMENFDSDKTPSEVISNFQQRYAEWAIQKFGSAKLAAQHFKSLNDNITDRTLYKWKNGK